MPIKFISNVCVRLTKPMSDTATEITIRTDDAVKLNKLGVGNYTYLVFSYNGNSEVVKYTHTATIPASTKSTVITVERDVEATGVYNFPIKACGCVDTSASAVIDLAAAVADEQGTTLVDCSGNEVIDGAAVVLCATYNAGQAAQDATIAQKVNNTVYLAGQAAQDAAIATKVDTATYNSGQAAQDAAIATKVDTATYNSGQAAQDAAIATKVDTATYNSDQAAQNIAIASKVNTSTYNSDQAAQNAAIALKQNALNDCSGNPLAGTVPTCAQMTTAIQTAIDALPADKFLQGLQSYNPVTNTMTLLMSDGSTVAIDMTDLLADAVAGGTSLTGAAGGDLEGTYPNPTVKDQAIADAVTGSVAVQTAVAGVFNRCNGTDMPAGAKLIECSAKGTDIPYLVGGVIPASQLPAYVDDVLEFPALANFPATGEAGKIYIDASTGKTYRWNGTGYTEIGASAGITVQDEGSVLTTAATSLNFVGAGVQATSSGGAVTVTVNPLQASKRVSDARFRLDSALLSDSTTNGAIFNGLNAAVHQSGTAPVTHNPATGQFTFNVSGWYEISFQAQFMVEATNPSPADYGSNLSAMCDIFFSSSGDSTYIYREQQLSSALLPYLTYSDILTVPTRHYNAGEWVAPSIVCGYPTMPVPVGTDVTLTGAGDVIFNIVLIEAD